MQRAVSVIAAVLALSAGATAAFADDPDQKKTAEADVLTRARPEFDALGIRAGSFFFYPALSAGFGTTDNVFNDQSNISDTLFTLGPEFRLQSAWSRHALALKGGAKIVSFSDQGGEDHTDWNLGADLRLDILRGTEFTADGHYALEHEPRGTDLTGGFNAGDPAEPTEYSRTGFGGAFAHTLNRVRLQVGASLDQFDFEDTPRVGGGAAINNDDRDRTATEIFGKVALKASEDSAVFVRGRWTQHDFDAAVDDDGFNRDSDSIGLDGGIEFEMTHMFVGQAFVGYEQRSYDDPAFSDTSQFGFGAGLKWFPSMLTTLSVDAARAIEETSILGASGYVSTRAQIGLDHELLRNVILSGRLSYENDDYLEVTRTDDVLHAALSGRYLIDNHFHLNAGWEYTNRDSTSLPFEYSTGQFQLSLTGKL